VYNRATLSLGSINTGTWSSRLGVEHKPGDLALQKKKKKRKSKEVTTGSNLTIFEGRLWLKKCWFASGDYNDDFPLINISPDCYAAVKPGHIPPRIGILQTPSGGIYKEGSQI
jgi:hypothetical protein